MVFEWGLTGWVVLGPLLGRDPPWFGLAGIVRGDVSGKGVRDECPLPILLAGIGQGLNVEAEHIKAHTKETVRPSTQATTEIDAKRIQEYIRTYWGVGLG